MKHAASFLRAAVLVALLVIPQSPLALLKDDHGSQQALFVPSETPGQPTESPSAGPVTPTPAPSATETTMAAPGNSRQKWASWQG